MDALSNMLRTIRLTGAILFESEFRAQWCYSTPEPRVLKEELLPGSERVLSFHFVTQGSCVARLAGNESIELCAGELVLIPRGDRHIVASSFLAADKLHPIEVTCDSLRLVVESPRQPEAAGSSTGSTKMICGYLAFGGYNSSSLLGDLPQALKIRNKPEVTAWLLASMRACLFASRSEQAGSSIFVEKIAELMLLEGLRQYVISIPKTDQSRLLHMKDRFVRKALTLIRDNVSVCWTVSGLAKSVGLSRSALAHRFVLTLGEPPMRYLMRSRLSLAADALLSTSDGVMKIAAHVGYESEAAFNRAFKREYGVPPATWRREAIGRSSRSN